MVANLISFCTRSITILFYLLFLLVPLFFVGNTYELFEFNKMWLTFGLTILIAFFWFTKMIAEKRFALQRTPLDIPILLFLLSQIIATFHSLDVHTSIWGYYSRFNGGLLSLIDYIFLYYAFVSNMTRKNVLRSLGVSIASAIVVALWGLPSHFGKDPTCLLFRGTLDVSCWTDAFKPTVRMFATLGQPDWMGAYLALLLPVTIGYLVINHSKRLIQDAKSKKHTLFSRPNLMFTFWTLTSILFYFDLIWTNSRSAIIAFWVALFLFAILSWWTLTQLKKIPAQKSLLLLIVGFVVLTFFIGTPFYPKTDKYTFHSLITHVTTKPASTSHSPNSSTTTQVPAQPAASTGELGGTDSGKIRSYVWKGALDIWLHNPLFGTGVETFAYAYYEYKPTGHNLTSEWDYLYNKAHNEYLNYLATTGAFGLGTYLLMIFLFLWYATRNLLLSKKTQDESPTSYMTNKLLAIGLVTGYISILITNFFGFSVVIMNVYLFIIPAFLFVMYEVLATYSTVGFGKIENNKKTVDLYQWTAILFLASLTLWSLVTLMRFWDADVHYALGYNLDRVNQYQEAYQPLHQAVAIRPGEPTFQDEMADNDASLTELLAYNKMATQAGQLANEAITTNNKLVTDHPNNVIFWKSRIRIFYILSQLSPQYLQTAVTAAEKAHALAPTDAKIEYNLALLYNQAGQTDKAIAAAQETIQLKKDYPDPYLALGVFYHEQAVGADQKTVVNPDKQQKAVDILNYLLTNVSPGNGTATQLLKSWK